jgi:hypothetical protein
MAVEMEGSFIRRPPVITGLFDSFRFYLMFWH